MFEKIYKRFSSGYVEELTYPNGRTPPVHKRKGGYVEKTTRAPGVYIESRSLPPYGSISYPTVTSASQAKADEYMDDALIFE